MVSIDADFEEVLVEGQTFTRWVEYGGPEDCFAIDEPSSYFGSKYILARNNSDAEVQGIDPSSHHPAVEWQAVQPPARSLRELEGSSAGGVRYAAFPQGILEAETSPPSAAPVVTAAAAVTALPAPLRAELLLAIQVVQDGTGERRPRFRQTSWRTSRNEVSRCVPNDPYNEVWLTKALREGGG